ncbi:MarR family winged helix-turn-helix transcriptional regulator [Desertivibrio insolitus]|uniref:MarR family winged helix-turn-helix transcriptional regulator n=1 Tax=Herbiconiux sp. SYSU D00978 TaxID=2812562 RepID=UPI001A96916E|nr:MarR family transcriptional regulator [Herbiconiux sp. SYSU D00978]
MSDPRWLTSVELSAWLRLVTVTELLPAALDSQLQRDAELTHFEYRVLAVLSEAPDRVLQMSALAVRTNSSLPRLSHVVNRLEQRGYLERRRQRDDRRATDAHLTDEGWRKVIASSPGHVAAARDLVVDALDREQLRQLDAILATVVARLDPDGRRSAVPPPVDTPAEGIPAVTVAAAE